MPLLVPGVIIPPFEDDGLQPYEFEFNGLRMGGDTAYGFVSISGLADMPEVRSADRTRMRRDGSLPGDDFLGSRSIILQFEVFGDDEEEFTAAYTALSEAFRPGQAESPLIFRVPGVAGGLIRAIDVRPRKLDSPVAWDWFYGKPVLSVELYATDPLIYGDEVEITGDDETVTVTNLGNYAAEWTLDITGPVTAPQVNDVTFNFGLASGHTLAIDSNARTAWDGTTNRYDKLTSGSTWFRLEPGDTEVTVNGSFTLRFRPAYWR